MTESERKFDGFWAEQEVAGASSDEQDDAERRIGYALPPELRELLSRQDGGPPNYCVVANVLVPPYAGVGSGARYGLIAELKHLKGIVVFASDGNAWFGLDYRTNPKCPSVVYWSEYDGRFEDDDTPYELAPSFAAFLGMCGTEDTLNLDE